ncbi:MAG: anti-sigma factor family protein [Candidatus Methylomirabilales bacterium]
MTCQELANHLDAFLDDELSVGENLKLQTHLVFCEACRRVVASEIKLRTLIEEEALPDEAPASLGERIAEQIRAQPYGGGSRALRRSPPGRRGFFIGLLTGVAAAGAILLVVSPLLTRGPEPGTPLAAEVVAKHQMYSQAETRLAVASAEPTTLARWFSGRVHFPLKLPLLARPGDRLIGGRLSSIADRRAAYLLYARGGHRLSLFIFEPPGGLHPPAPVKKVEGVPFYTSTLQGRSVVWWEDREVYYAATGDEDLEALIEFALLCVKGRTLSVS